MTTALSPAAATVAPRFRGATALVRLAKIGDETALAALQMTAQDRERAALRGQLTPPVVQALQLESVRRQAEVRAARAQRPNYDRISERTPGGAEKRLRKVAFERALAVARFRSSTHGAETKIKLVGRGQEGATSTTTKTSPQKVGLPNAYSRKAFFVVCSSHEFRVSAAFWSVADRVEPGVVWLTPELRVRQGRGTSLVVERVTPKARRAA